MKNLTRLCLALFMISITFSCSKESIDPIDSSESINLEKNNNANKSTTDVFNPILNEVTGTATLHRNANGITINYHTTGLTPGYAYTLWWVIWNNPGECLTPNGCGDPDNVDFLNPETEVDVLYAGGHVVGNSGVGNFSGHLNTGDESDSVNGLMGIPAAGGLQIGNVYDAEVHLVLRSHGPAIPGSVNEQIGGYVGGCSDPFAFPPFSEIPDEVGECGDIEFAIFSPVNE